MKVLLLIIVAVPVLIAFGCASNSTHPVTRSEPMIQPDIAPNRDYQVSQSAERNLKAHGIEGVRLEVRDGQVTLIGLVQTMEQRKMAEQTVKDTPGVVAVENLLDTPNEMPAYTAPAARSDSVNVNKPGGPRKDGNVNIRKLGGPRKNGQP
jgi:hypothetical protein